jgi:hypothetical protein
MLAKPILSPSPFLYRKPTKRAFKRHEGSWWTPFVISWAMKAGRAGMKMPFVMPVKLSGWQMSRGISTA